MNEMYNMSVVTHGSLVFLLLGMILVNYLLLVGAGKLSKYRRTRSVIITPLDFIALGGVIFTGVVMMASKHLDFTVENIVMVVASILFIFAEVKRSQEFKYIKSIEEFSGYKSYAKKILLAEFAITLIISIWMLS